MALSINSTMKELLADEKAKAIIDTGSGWTDDPRLQQAMGMSLKELASYMPEMTDEALSKL